MALINPISAGQGLNPGAAPTTARDNSVASGLESLDNAVGRAVEVQQRLQEINQKRERFTAELLWQRTQRELEALHEEALRNAAPGATDFALGISETIDRHYE